MTTYSSHEERLKAHIALLEGYVKEALELAAKYGGIDGDHHKAWVIDQMVRALTAYNYSVFVARAKSGEDGPDTYSWEEGIGP